MGPGRPDLEMKSIAGETLASLVHRRCRRIGPHRLPRIHALADSGCRTPAALFPRTDPLAARQTPQRIESKWRARICPCRAPQHCLAGKSNQQHGLQLGAMCDRRAPPELSRRRVRQNVLICDVPTRVATRRERECDRPSLEVAPLARDSQCAMERLGSSARAIPAGSTVTTAMRGISVASGPAPSRPLPPLW